MSGHWSLASGANSGHEENRDLAVNIYSYKNTNSTARLFVRFGSLADICSAKRHVRFTPRSGH
jgi:hypothetical protein